MALRSKLWVSAQIKQCDLAARQAVVTRRGDPDAGSIILKLDRLDGTCVLLSQIRDANGERCWLRIGGTDSMADAEADDYLQQRTSSDPDLWILEIEDKHADYQADAPIVS